MPANSTNAFCSFGVIKREGPLVKLRVSRIIMTMPTMARRELMARTMTAERMSPRSNDRIGAAFGSANASAASRTALCSSGPMLPSVSHRTSPV